MSTRLFAQPQEEQEKPAAAATPSKPPDQPQGKTDADASSPGDEVTAGKRSAADGASRTEPALADQVLTPIEGIAAVQLESGVTVWDIKVGHGESVRTDATVVAHYAGWVKGGELFDTSRRRKRPSQFELKSVLPGFSVGFTGMKPGGIRRIEIPPDMAYGGGGREPRIPPNATLIYEVELFDVMQVSADFGPTSVAGLEPSTTKSGVKYWDIKTGSGKRPPPQSIITAHYSGWLENGKLFHTTLKESEPERFAIDKVIAGLGEGIGTMQVGGKRRLEIPAELGYGADGLLPYVPPNSRLFFEVELFDVSAPLPKPKQTSVDDIKPVELPSGLKYWDIKVGDGISPDPVSFITAHYAGWLEDGTMFDNTFEMGRPMRIRLSKLVKGWIEGLEKMKVGGKRRLKIPPEVGFGEQGSPPHIPPNATLIYEVELLAVEN